MNVDVNELKSWIGNEETTFDEVTKSLESRFRATLDIDPDDPKNGEIASSGLHWALGPAVVKSSLLGKILIHKKEIFYLLSLFLEECGLDVEHIFFIH